MRSPAWFLILVGCATGRADPLDTDVAGDTDVTDTDVADTDDTDPPCAPEGTFDCPIVVDSFPFVHAGDTTAAPGDAIDSYACAPSTDESGGELVYRVDLPGPGAVIADVVDGADVDVDVHLLDDADPDACRTRDDTELAWVVDGGSVWIVADTWVSGGTPQAGPYTLTIDLEPLPSGDCAFLPTDLRMYWTECAPGIDCSVGTDVVLHTPSVGPVVKEAHLVTVEDDFGGGWPTSYTDGIAAHYALSESATGYVMDRGEPWAPAGEGGSEYGQGATGAPLPVEDEAWYVNMYWRDRPAKGTRMLVWNPANGRVVVASGGYETGPGSNTAIGGASEEIHDALGTGHRDPLVMGFPVDDTLPLGPIDCP